MRVLRLPSALPMIRRAACCGAGVALIAGVAPPVRAAPVVPEQPVASFVVTPVEGRDTTPTISAAHGVVGWSQPTHTGSWGLRLATAAGGDLGHTFDAQPWPIDVSVGTLHGRADVYWSHCPKTSTAVARRVADGCDVVRLRDLARNAPMVRFPGASSSAFSETAPARDENRLVFARRAPGSSRAFALQRDVARHTNRTLAGGPVGACSSTASCAKFGALAAGPDQLSVDGSRWAMRWRTFGGADGFGISDNDQILGGQVVGTRSKIIANGGPAGLVSGTCSERRYGSVQQIGTVVQAVRHDFDCDATPSTGSDVVVRSTAGGQREQYADPQGRRIVAAAADGGRLWMLREVQPYAYASSTGEPAFCSAAVGGCDVVAVDEPDFVDVANG